MIRILDRVRSILDGVCRILDWVRRILDSVCRILDEVCRILACLGRQAGRQAGRQREGGREGRPFTVAAVTVAAAACSVQQPSAPRSRHAAPSLFRTMSFGLGRPAHD